MAAWKRCRLKARLSSPTDNSSANRWHAVAPRGDAETVSLDLRTAVHGAVSLRVNQPELPWPPLDEQVDRFLVKLVGVPPAEG